jgi:hypothetical protein
MKLRVYASLAEDINNGWVWVPECLTQKRSVVKITNIDSGKKIYCEVLPISDNFKIRYNEGNRTFKISDKEISIVINEWYRHKLCINKTQEEYNFEVMVSDNYLGHIMASLHHPQVIVRIATNLGILGLLLGVIGLL